MILNKTKLADLIINLESGSREKGGSIASGVISIGGTHISNTGGFRWGKKEFVSRTFFAKMKSGKTKINDILIVKDGATTGKTSFIDTDFEYKEAAINEHIFRLEIDKEKAIPKYIFYFLYSDEGQREILKDFRGATVGGISRNFIDLVTIPLPDIETQNKIVAILDKASSLIRKREESISMLDKLLRATFLDMFGDPVINEKGWRITKMNKVVIAINSGTSYGGEERTQLQSDELGVLKISAVTKGIFDPLQIKAVAKDQIKKEVLMLKKGMFLLSRANTRELVAACCIVDHDYPNLFLPDKLWSLEIDIKIILPQYLNFLFKNENYRKLISKKASGGHESMLNISMKKFRSLDLPIPPINFQNEFNNIIQKNAVLKKVLIRSQIELDKLNRVLSQKVFNGQLNLNADFELDTLTNEIDLQNKENEDYSAKDNYRTDLKKISNKITEKKSEAENKNIPFNETEGNAIFNKVFSKKKKVLGLMSLKHL